MYIWKCWRDTRSFFIVFLVIAAAAMPVTAMVGVGTRLVEGFGNTVFLPAFLMMLFVAALGLGTICAIQEFTEKTTHFLLTKPRPRAYFVWLGWAVGCIELLTIALVNLLAGWVTLAHYSKGPFRFVFFDSVKEQDLVGVLIYTLYIYGLTYSLTVILRNGLKGLGASMGITFGLQAIAIAFRVRWNVRFPVPPLPIGGLPIFVSNIVWILVGLLLVFAAQIVIECAEV